MRNVRPMDKFWSRLFITPLFFSLLNFATCFTKSLSSIFLPILMVTAFYFNTQSDVSRRFSLFSKFPSETSAMFNAGIQFD